jgi:hypothetical protein
MSMKQAFEMLDQAIAIRYRTFMHKKIILSLSLVTLFACGHKNVAPDRGGKILKTQVSQYTEISYRPTLLNKETTFNFIQSTEGDLKLITLNSSVIQHCTDALTNKGYKVKLNATECTNCINVTATNSDDRDSEKSSLVDCFTEANPNQNNCFGGLAKTYKREIKLSFADPKTQKVVHSIETTSEGPSDSITKVAKEMCFASFIDFPDATIKASHIIPYPLPNNFKMPETATPVK